MYIRQRYLTRGQNHRYFMVELGVVEAFLWIHGVLFLSLIIRHWAACFITEYVIVPVGKFKSGEYLKSVRSYLI